ncbi:MAG: carbohydrate binding domain-containing protein, partial [Patescibacteria group bacterium]
MNYQIAGDITNPRNTYTFPNATTSLVSSYQTYSYEDRLYLTHAAKACTQDQAGCTELNVQDAKLTLNLIQNGSFEKDEDGDKSPDGWKVQPTDSTKQDSDAFDGNSSLKTLNTNTIIIKSVSVTPGSFYTFSFYAKATAATSLIPKIRILPKKQDGTNLDLTGLSYSKETCELSVNDSYLLSVNNASANDGWKRFTCSFSLPNNASQLDISFAGLGYGDNFLYDAFQLESGENATAFTENGYNVSKPAKAYLKLAPAYFGCTGKATDHAECKKYAPLCGAQDVGCNRYKPVENGPNVPAITSDLDKCP